MTGKKTSADKTDSSTGRNTSKDISKRRVTQNISGQGQVMQTK